MSRQLLLLVALGLTLIGCGKTAPEPVEGLEVSPTTFDPGASLGAIDQKVGCADCPNCENSSGTWRYNGTGPKPYEGVCPCCENTGRLQGNVGWERGAYDAPGYSPTRKAEPSTIDRARAERAAKTVAIRNAVAVAATLQLDEENLLEVRSGEIQLEAFVTGQREIKKDWFPGSGQPWAYSKVEVPMHGARGLTARVIDYERGVYTPSGERFAASEDVTVHGQVSHIIIDAREVGVGPALCPKVLTEQGEIVYDVQTPDAAAAHEAGIVQYYTSDDPFSALQSLERRGWGDADEPVQVALLGRARLQLAQRRRRRSGKWKPVVIKASPAGQGRKCDVLVTRNDAARVHAANQKGGALKNARVIVVVGSRVAGRRGARPAIPRLALR